MRILLTNAQIFDPLSPFHGQQKHLLVENGFIKTISDAPSEADVVVSSPKLIVSQGWVDMRAYTGEPGLEHKEDFQSLTLAAASGGYTHVGLMPNTLPVIQTKDAVLSLVNRSKQNVVNFLPLAAATLELKGEAMTEALDLHYAGAVAFSDGDKSIKNSALVVKLLQYLSQVDGILMLKPEDRHLSSGGQMNEGVTSTFLGLKGSPSIAENIQLQRDIELLKYAGGRLHVTGISTEASVESIRRAKKAGLQITCDVNFYQLVFDETAMVGFDTNHKVNPPYRTKKDIKALLKGIEDGTIDAIVTGHHGQDTESKKLEFDLAEVGALGLEVAFAALCTQVFGETDMPVLLDKLTTQPRKILHMAPATIQEGQRADLTFFDPTLRWTFAKTDIHSKSENTPFVGTAFKGKVLGVIRGERYSIQSNPNV